MTAPNATQAPSTPDTRARRAQARLERKRQWLMTVSRKAAMTVEMAMGFAVATLLHRRQQTDMTDMAEELSG